MNRNHSGLGALLVVGATLLTTGAYAEDPRPAPQAKGQAADKVDKVADKVDKAGDKVAKGAKDAKDSVDGKAKSVEARASRQTKEHDAQREKLRATWKGPVSDTLRQELRRHAERLARLERIKEVGETEKDKDASEKATKLIAKENERHDKWMTKNAPPASATPAAAPIPNAVDGKEGAK